jgi:hypothetical protein
MLSENHQARIKNYLHWLSDRGLTIPFFRSEDSSELKEPESESEKAAPYQDDPIKMKTLKDDIKITNAIAEKSLTPSTDGSTNPTEAALENTEEDSLQTDEPATILQSKVFPKNPEKMTHETLSLKFYGSITSSHLFVMELDSEAEFHPSTSMITKIAGALKLDKSQFSIAIVRGHRRNQAVNSDHQQYVLNELARLVAHIETSSPNHNPINIVVMGSHTLSLFDPDAVFFEQNGEISSFGERPYLTTWHPMDMAHQVLLKKDCWQALQKLS